MKVRIAFRSDIVLEGETMQEIRERWEALPLYSDEANHKCMEFIEIDAIEDADTNHDISKEWDAAYNGSDLYWDEDKKAVILEF